MAKTQEELNALKEEVETVGKKLAELTDEELEQVCGGAAVYLVDIQCPENISWENTPRLEIFDELLKDRGE